MTPEKFWERVDIRGPDECWNWKLKPNNAGYGTIGSMGAHRYAYMLTHGIDHLDRHTLICHTCDNRLCCNPNHHYVGTHKKNTEDIYRRGRHAGRVKLNEQNVRKILSLYSSGKYRQQDLANMFGVGVSSIQNIVVGRTWSYLHATPE